MPKVFGVLKTIDGIVLRNAPIKIKTISGEYSFVSSGAGYFEIDLPAGKNQIYSNTGLTLTFNVPNHVESVSLQECLTDVISNSEIKSISDLSKISIKDNSRLVGVEKIRDDFKEYRIFVPLRDGYYESWLFTDRFYSDSATFQTEPGLICSSLAQIFEAGANFDIPLNNESYEQVDPGATYIDVGSGTETGTFTDDLHSTRRTINIGDQIQFSITVNEPSTILNRILENTVSGIIEYQITGDSEITWIIPDSGGKRLLDTDIPSGVSRANIVPLAEVAPGNYTITAIYDSNASGSSRVAIGGIYVVGGDRSQQGILGLSLEGNLGDTELLIHVGQKFIYVLPPAGKIIWKTYGSSTAGIAIVKLYRSTDGLLLKDLVADLSLLPNGDQNIEILGEPILDETYLEIEVSQETNSNSSPQRTWIYTRGVEAASATAGDPVGGRIDLIGQEYNVQSGSALGTSIISSAGNIASPINFVQPGTGFNAAYFVSGIHGYTNFTSLECFFDGKLTPIESGAIGQRWEGREVKLIVEAETYFPESFAATPIQAGRVRCEYTFSDSLEISTTWSFDVDTQVHIAYTHALGVGAPEDTNQDITLGYANKYYIPGPGVLEASANRASQGDRDTQSGTDPANLIIFFGEKYGHAAELLNINAIENLEVEHTGMSPSENSWVLDYRFNINGGSTKAYKKLKIPSSQGVLFPANSQLSFTSKHKTFLTPRLGEVLDG